MAMTGCDFDDDDTRTYVVPVSHAQEVTFASFNVSFAVDGDKHDNFQRWVGFMGLSSARQDELIAFWRIEQSKPAADKEAPDYKLAERVIQIRNIAAIIQKNRPDVLLLNEFNNDGSGESRAALEGFQKNYLAHSQSLNSVDGGDLLEPIEYPFTNSYATNTGLRSALLGDDHGFGFYHGQYAFALFSKYEIDSANTRTFQALKWKDLPGASNPVIHCDSAGKPLTGKDLPADKTCGDVWYSEAQWNDIRLSSKNHVDAPIIIPTPNGGERVIHALLSHPTPSIDGAAAYNTERNGAENGFWAQYLDGVALPDDKGVSTPFAADDFVLMGDLNADFLRSPGNSNGFGKLVTHARINHSVSLVGEEFVPISLGATYEPNIPPAYDKEQGPHPFPETRTSTFGSRVDYALPSATLPVSGTGVYWAAAGEPGRLLFNDARIGKRGTDKEVSSDHRYVWATVKLNAK